MGASWNGIKSGTFGDISCFSTQTYKHMNSGEGGLLITSDDALMAKAIIHSGSYMLFDQHQAAPPKSTFDQIRLDTPNYSGRMDNLRAAILRPQLADLDTQCQRWNERYEVLKNTLNKCEKITIPERLNEEQFVASSFQLSIGSFDSEFVGDQNEERIMRIVNECHERGVILKWFGNNDPMDYTSRYDSWRYIDEMPTLPKTEKVLSTLLDMRIPLTFSLDDCQLIAEIIVQVVEEGS
jgi:dTDP-4-amino-4,6-dideoxygalactose transaminase